MSKHTAVPACHTLVTKANSSHCMMMSNRALAIGPLGPLTHHSLCPILQSC